MRWRQAPAPVLASCLLLVFSACDSCSRHSQVPFKLGPAVATPPAPPTPTPASAPSATGTTSVAYADGTLGIVVETVKLQRSEGAFRAALAVDLDGDGVRDALLVTTDKQGRPFLEIALRREHAFTSPTPALQLVEGDQRCSVERSSIAALGAEVALVDMSLRCALVAPTQTGGTPMQPMPAGQPPTPPDTAAAVQDALQTKHVVLTLEAAPRILLSIGQGGGPHDSGLTLAIASEDLDSDEHADVRVDVQLHNDNQDPLRVSLAWLNRPSGLARQSAEPEQTLAALATTAGQFLPKNPGSALAAAERVLAFHRLLCRESGSAELRVDDQAGIVCGASAAAGRAAVTASIALARGHELFPTLEALAALDSPAYRVDAAQKARARAALALIPGDTSFTWYPGPEQRAPDAPHVRMSALSFIDENQLLVRGATARSFQLLTGEVASVALSPSILWMDAPGRLAAVDVVNACDGIHLRVVPVTQIIGGAVTNSASAGPDDLLIERAPVVDPHCEVPAQPRHPDGTGLGYTAAGVLVASGAELTLLPVTAEKPAGAEPHVLAAGEPAPALLSPGALSADGLRHALATSEGVALVQRGATTKVRLVRSPASCTGTPSDVALSASGERIAMLCGGSVYYAQVAANEAPQPTAAPAAEAPASPAAAATPTHPTLPVEQLPPPAPEHEPNTGTAAMPPSP